MKNEKVMTESKLVDNIHTSTKGNQNKWFDGKYWYKADGLGYEGLAEFVVSSLLKYTNVPNYVEYSLIPLKYKNKAYIGCMSKNFLSEGRTVTLKKLISTYKNKNIYDELSKFETLRDKIKYVVDFVEDITEIKFVRVRILYSVCREARRIEYTKRSRKNDCIGLYYCK